MTLTEAMSYKFLAKFSDGSTAMQDGKNCGDKLLTHYANVGKGEQQVSAKILLEQSHQTKVGSGIVRVQNQKAYTPPTPPPPPPAPEPSEYEQFVSAEEVELPAPPPVKSMALVPNAGKPSRSELYTDTNEIPEWAQIILIRLNAVLDMLDTLIEKQSAAPAQAAPAVGGEGGDKFEVCTRAVVVHKNNKIYIDFWNDDNNKLKYAVIYAAKTKDEWLKLIPWINPKLLDNLSAKDWVSTFPDFDKPNEFPFKARIFYILSSRLNQKGNPFKDIVRIERVNDPHPAFRWTDHLHW